MTYFCHFCGNFDISDLIHRLFGFQLDFTDGAHNYLYQVLTRLGTSHSAAIKHHLKCENV